MTLSHEPDPVDVERDEPVWSDDETADPSVGSCACGAPCSAGNGVCDRCFERGMAELRAKAPPQPEARPCSGCGKPSPWTQLDDAGRCDACSKEAASQAQMARVQAKVEQRMRDFEASPHRCAGGCGEKVLVGGETCPHCHEKHLVEAQRAYEAQQVRGTIPKHLRWARFRDPQLRARVKDPRALDLLRKAFEGGAARYLFLGPAGVGKSVTAAALLPAICYRRRLDGLFVDAFELSIARQNAPLGEEVELVQRARDVGALVIDDLGAERAVASSAIPEIIHARHAEDYVTIVTSGFSLAELEQRYGSGVLRRLAEDACVLDMRPARKAAP